MEVAELGSGERHLIRTRNEYRRKVGIGKMIVREGTLRYTKYNLITGLALSLVVKDLANNSELELDLKQYKLNFVQIKLLDNGDIVINDYEKCLSLTIRCTDGSLVPD